MTPTLTPIPGASGFVLDTGAAESLGRAITDGCPVYITNSYRDPAWQQQLYNGWVNRLPGYNFALPPDQSNHCKGIAVDVSGPMLTWLNANGAAYGWTRDPNEPWHFNYYAATDAHLGDDLTTQFETDVRADLYNKGQQFNEFLADYQKLEQDLRADLFNKGAQLTAVTAALHAIATSQGIDPAALTATIDAAVKAALSGMTFTATP